MSSILIMERGGGWGDRIFKKRIIVNKEKIKGLKLRLNLK